MKILIFTPIWKRPEILREYVRSLERLPEHELLVIVSPEDPHHDEINDILPDCWKVECENKPFGRKKNTGLEGARQLKWDYLMELNSDSIVNPRLFELYKPYMDRKTPFFGLKNLFCTDYATKKSLSIPDYNTDMTFGSGRMLHRDALLIDKLWTDELNDGIDTNMMKRLKKVGIKETVVDNGEIPMIVDLKTNTSIWHFKLLETRGFEISYDYLTKHIGYDFISS
jgi:hypothetical protein